MAPLARGGHHRMKEGEKETWNIGSRASCIAGPNQNCGGLLNVVCTGGLAGSNVEGARYAIPRQNSQITTAAPRLEGGDGDRV